MLHKLEAIGSKFIHEKLKFDEYGLIPKIIFLLSNKSEFYSI